MVLTAGVAVFGSWLTRRSDKQRIVPETYSNLVNDLSTQYKKLRTDFNDLQSQFDALRIDHEKLKKLEKDKARELRQFINKYESAIGYIETVREKVLAEHGVELPALPITIADDVK